ncbi:MFS transporter [Nocardia tengchongensis]
MALPSIRSALEFAPIDLAWVVHIYALTFGGFLLLGGRAGDLYGRRRLFVGGLIAFGVTSLAGGLVQEPWQLIAARAAQGVAAAAIAPATLALLTTLFPEGQPRLRAFGVWSAANASGGALGVLVGGLLTEYMNWRWVMLVNLPIIAIVLACAAIGIPLAATIGIPARDAGMASGLLNSARQLGGAIGLAALSAVAADRLRSATSPEALTSSYALPLALAAGLLVIAAVVAALVLPTRRNSAPTPASIPVAAK